MSAEPWNHLDRITVAWQPVIDQLAAIGVKGDVAMLGGGCFCLHVPLAEDHTRWVWLGCDDQCSEPLWIDQFGPQNFLGGYAYWSDNGDGTDAHQCPLPDRAVNRDDPQAPGLYAALIGHLISGHNVAPRSRDIPDMEAQHRELHP